MTTITLPDGSIRDFEGAPTGADVAASIGAGLARAAIAVEVDGEVVDLIRQSGVSRKEFSFFSDEGEFMQLAAKTPRSNCVMNSTKLARAGIVLTEVHAAVARDLGRWQKAV